MIIWDEGQEFLSEKRNQRGGSLWKSQHLLQDGQHSLSVWKKIYKCEFFKERTNKTKLPQNICNIEVTKMENLIFFIYICHLLTNNSRYITDLKVISVSNPSFTASPDSYLPPSSLVSRHPMRWMSCCEMNSLVMTNSSWLKSALCSSDSTGSDFRNLHEMIV